MAKQQSQKKTVARQRKARRRAEHDRQRAYFMASQAALNAWKPTIKYETAAGSPAFVTLVKAIIERLPYESETAFPQQFRELLTLLKRDGLLAVCGRLHKEYPDHAIRDHWYREFTFLIGRLVANQLTEDEKRRFLPYNDLHVHLDGKAIKIIFGSLATRRLNGDSLFFHSQPCYYSRRKTTVEINGVGKIVAFTDHAIERIRERAVPNWRTYEGLADAFAFFADCLYYELATIRGQDDREQIAISLYQDCYLDQWRSRTPSQHNRYFTEVIGLQLQHLKKQWYYRVGYCPLEIKGEFAIATTFLPPGFRATPEHALIWKSDLDRDQRQELLARAKQQACDPNSLTTDLKLVKWFHDHGIPQVRSFPHDVFAPPAGLKVSRSLPIDSPMADFSNLPAELKHYVRHMPEADLP